MTITSQHGPWSNFDIKFIHFQDMSWPDTGHNPIQICPCCESCPTFAPFKKAQKVVASNFNRTNIDLNSHHCASWIITSIYEIILSTGGIALEQFNHVTSSRHPLVFPMWRVHTYRWLLMMQKSRNQGAVSIRKTVLQGMVIPMLKIRRPNGRLIFNMEITIRR